MFEPLKLFRVHGHQQELTYLVCVRLVRALWTPAFAFGTITTSALGSASATSVKASITNLHGQCFNTLTSIFLGRYTQQSPFLLFFDQVVKSLFFSNFSGGGLMQRVVSILQDGLLYIWQGEEA